MDDEGEKIARPDPDYFYREAINDLGRLNNRRFARPVSGGVQSVIENP